MKKPLAITLFTLSALTAQAAPPTMAAGADGNSIAFKNGATEAVVIHDDGTIEASTPTANNHVATKEYVDTQMASASGSGGASFMMISTTASPACPTDWTVAYSGWVATPTAKSSPPTTAGNTICSPRSGWNRSDYSANIGYDAMSDSGDELYCSICVK